jgi:hypothetical protein
MAKACTAMVRCGSARFVRWAGNAGLDRQKYKGF